MYFLFNNRIYFGSKFSIIFYDYIYFNINIWKYFYNKFLIWSRLVYILTKIFGLITFSMVCFTAFDQLFSTNYRYNLREICSLSMSLYLISLSICIWFLHDIICSLFINIAQTNGCIIKNQIFIQYFTYFFLIFLD
jgi:hypothetical protein